jgi:uncharacterized membrane protein YgcG
MEPNTLSYILLGILAAFVLFVAVQKIISSVRLSRSEKVRRQAEFDARHKVPSDRAVQRAQNERARMQAEFDARSKEHNDRERIRREHPTTDSGDNSMYIAALAVAGYDYNENHHSDSHHTSHADTDTGNHGSTSGWSDSGSSSSSDSSSSSSSSDGGGGGGGD